MHAMNTQQLPNLPRVHPPLLNLRGGGAFGGGSAASLSLSSPTSKLCAIGASSLFCLLLHELLHRHACERLLGTSRWGRMKPGTKHLFVHEMVASLLCSVAMCVLYANAVVDLGSRETMVRWEGASEASRAALAIHLGMTLYDAGFAFPKDASKTLVYYLHHLATLAVFLPVLFCERLHFFASAAALVECTNPFIGVVQNIDRAGLLFPTSSSSSSSSSSQEDKRGRRGVEAWNWPVIQLAVGAGLIPTWFVVRLLGLPIVMFVFAKDWPVYFRGQGGPAGAAASSSSRAATRVLGAACAVAMTFIWLLSILWFVEIIKVALSNLSAATAEG